MLVILCYRTYFVTTYMYKDFKFLSLLKDFSWIKLSGPENLENYAMKEL